MDADAPADAPDEAIAIHSLPPEGPAWDELFAALQALWAAGERDWLAPLLAKGLAAEGGFEELRQESAASGVWWVARAGERLAGFVLLGAPRVLALWVRPELRRRGIGRQLLQRAEAVAQRAGYPFIEIESPAGNKTAVAFCRALGYRYASRRTVQIDEERVGSVVVFALLAHKYSHPRWLRTVMVFGAVMFALGAILSASQGQRRPALLFLGFALLCAVEMLWSERVVWTDERGVYAGYWNNRLRHIPWTALESIRGGIFDQTLTLRGAGQVIKVDPYLANFAWLIDVVRLARPGLWRKTDRREFRRSRAVDVVLVLLAAAPWALLGWLWRSGTGVAWWLWAALVALGVCCLYVPLSRPYRLRIGDDALYLRYPIRERVIAASDIARVEITRQPGVAGAVYAGYAVTLLLTDGRRISLDGFGGGVGEFSNTLFAWHQRATQDDAP